MVFDQLSLVWQVWGYMLLGAILMGCGLLVGIEWAWLAFTARVAWTTFRTWCRRTFADPPTRPLALGTNGSSPRRLDADEILIGLRVGTPTPNQCPQRFRVQATPHADDTLRRRQLLALAETSPFRKTVH